MKHFLFVSRVSSTLLHPSRHPEPALHCIFYPSAGHLPANMDFVTLFLRRLRLYQPYKEFIVFSFSFIVMGLILRLLLRLEKERCCKSLINFVTTTSTSYLHSSIFNHSD